MKKYLSAILAVCMVVTMIPFAGITAFAEKITSRDFEYYVYNDGTAEIIDYTGTATNLEIPSEIDGYAVTQIGDYAFQKCTSLKSVTIPNSVTKIDDYAFEYCTSLTSITIPDSVTKIGNRAFEMCTSLTSITIPDSVTEIGEYSFYGCTLLTSITIPDSVTKIGFDAFGKCTSLTSITIPDSVTRIGGYAFEKCTSLTSITIPNSMTEIGKYVFYHCTLLTSITIPDSVTRIGSGVFECCTSLTSITIPNSVTSIGDYAFYGCTSLASVIIPDSVTSVGLKAFFNCESLTDVYYCGMEEQWNNISIGTNNECLTNATIHFNSASPSEPVFAGIKYGADRFSFGEDISGHVGDEIRSLLLYTSQNENIASLDITSSNTDVVEIGMIEIGIGDYITSENEHIATIPLKLKAEGTSTITITSPEGVSTSVEVISKKSCYEIKLYSEIPAMIVGKGRKIGAAVQLENNGTVFEENINTSYSFVSSNNDIVTLSDIRKESDGTYFTINGVKEGKAIITITENNTGAVFSGIVQVNAGILTFNAEAMPSYYDRNNEYNGYIGGMYIDEFKMTEKNNDTMSVTFNVYNTANIVGAVDIYDSNGNIIRSEQIKRFDGGYVTSIKDTLISGYKLVEDIFITKNLLTYKQDNYSVKTSIEIEVPKGGHIEITDDPLYSNTCAIFNYTEFITTSIMLFGDVVSVDADTKKEISEITGKNIVDKFLKEYIAALSGKSCNEKIAKLGEKFIEKLTEKSLEKILSSSITGDLASFVDEGKAVLEECDINLGDTIVSAAGSIGISIAESTLKKAMGPFGEVLNGMFKFSEYASYSNFLVDICKSHENHALRVYFDNENGCLSNNGVSVKSENGNTDLSALNYVMHSIVLSEDEDLSNEIKDSLNNISDKYIVRNIYLERDGVISQPGQTVQVYMPIPDDYDPNKCKLYWVKDDGTLESKDFTIVGSNIMFTTDHFSYWALVSESSILQGECGDNLTYSYNANTSVLTITGEGDMWDWKVATTPWRDFKENISCVKIDEGVTKIGNFAFTGFTSVTEVQLPNTVTSLGTSSFARCTSLENITLPNSITIINSSAFYNCIALTDITLPDSVVTLGDSVFGNCIKFDSFVFPNNVTSIGAHFFEGCTNLCDVEFSERINTIPSYAFFGCTRLKEIEIPAHITNIGTYTFRDCLNLEYVYIPSSVTSIGNGVFMGCSSLESITIPDSVISIGIEAFENCTNLKNVTIGNNVTSIGMKAFENCISMKSITIPDSVKRLLLMRF